MHPVHRATALRVVLLGMSLLALLPLVVSNSACTLIGLAIGVAGSADAPPQRLPAGSVFKVGPGALIVVATKEQKEYSGVYLGRSLVEDTSYTSRYGAWGAASPRAPALGAGVEIELENGSRVHGAFDGFTYRAARVVVDPKLGAETFPFKRIRWLRADSLERWTGDELAHLDVSGGIPTREAIRVGIVRPFSWSWRSSSGISNAWIEAADFPEQVVVPADRIAGILVHGRSAAPLVLGLVGLAIDILVVRSYNEQRNNDECAGPSGPAPTLSNIERSEVDFLPFTGEFGPLALAAVPPDSSSATRDR
jgi:hypothetical protein